MSELGPLKLKVITAADHFQIDVDVIHSLPTARQWSHGSTSHIYFLCFHNTIAQQMPTAAGKPRKIRA